MKKRLVLDYYICLRSGRRATHYCNAVEILDYKEQFCNSSRLHFHYHRFSAKFQKVEIQRSQCWSGTKRHLSKSYIKKNSCEKVLSLLMWQFHSENSGGLASCYTSYMLICGLKCVASAELTEKISSYNLHINTYSYV